MRDKWKMIPNMVYYWDHTGKNIKLGGPPLIWCPYFFFNSNSSLSCDSLTEAEEIVNVCFGS